MAYLPSTNQSTRQPINSNINTAVVKNWRTTLIGFILAFSGFVAYSPNSFGGENAFIVQLCKYINIGGLATFGLVAKDFNSNGARNLATPVPDANLNDQ